MKIGAEIIHLGEQNDDICMWAVVDPEAEDTKRYFHVVGTGNEFDPSDKKYIGSAQVSGGKFVFHIWERIK